MRWPLACCLGAAASLAVFACGDLFHNTDDWQTLCQIDASAPPCLTGSSTHGASTSDSTTGTGSSSSGTGGSGAGGSGGGGSGGNPCPAYCKDITNNCIGADQQYSSLADCNRVCGELPHSGGNKTDDIECRALQASQASANTGLCVKAGPSGGNKCGTGCDAYCWLMVTVCASVYTSTADCNTNCENFDSSTPYDVSQTSGSTLACHIYWATQAGANSMACENAGPTSTTCVNEN